ncbi:MAG: PDZ domain-containing protein [Acidobacteriota bacterium]
MLFRDQLFYIFPISEMSKVEGLPVSGIIGYELLKRLITEVDYDGGMINFTTPAEFVAPKDTVAIPFTFESETPQIEGKIDGLPGLFTIDTGSRSTLDLNAPFVAEHGLHAKHPEAIESTTGWGVGGAAKSRVTRLGKLELGTGPEGTGSVSIENIVTGFSLQKKGAMAKSNLAGNIGGGLLKRFDVTFDYGKQVMYLKPNSNAKTHDAYDRAGIWLLTDPEGLRVKDVAAGGPAAKAGLKVDDLIVAIDGKKATEIALPDLRIRLANDPEGTKVGLTVKGKKGKERAVGMVLRELV